MFAGGATLGAAQRVCAGAGVDGGRRRAPPRPADRQVAHLHRPLRRRDAVPDAPDPVRLRGRPARRAGRRGTPRSRAHAEWVRDLAAAVGFGAQDDGRDGRRRAGRGRRRPRRRSPGRSTPTPSWRSRSARCSPRSGSARCGRRWAGSCSLVPSPPPATATRRRARRGAGWASVFSTMVQDLEAADRLADEATAEASRHRATLRRSAAPSPPGRSPPAIAATARPSRGRRRHGSSSPQAGRAVGLGHVSFAEGRVEACSTATSTAPGRASARPPRSSGPSRTTSG